MAERGAERGPCRCWSPSRTTRARHPRGPCPPALLSAPENSRLLEVSAPLRLLFQVTGFVLTHAAPYLTKVLSSSAAPSWATGGVLRLVSPILIARVSPTMTARRVGMDWGPLFPGRRRSPWQTENKHRPGGAQTPITVKF